MNPTTRDHRKEAIDSLLYAQAWLDNMYDKAEEDRRNVSHYGFFVVEYNYKLIYNEIKNAINEIRDMKTPNLGVILRAVNTEMSMLEDDLSKGEEIAKPYYMFFADMRLNIKQAEWSMILANKQEGENHA